MRNLNTFLKRYSASTCLAAAFFLPVSLQAADGYGNTATGGTGGSTVIVTNKATFQSALNLSGPAIVQFQGIVDFGGTVVISGKANKTIIGLNANAGWIGNVQFKHCTNFIVRNMKISTPASADGMTIQDVSQTFWVDHCTFGNCADGQLDITHGADNVTVSWCKFSYTSAQTTHRFCSLVGHDDTNGAEDSGKLHITYHHNWWSTLVTERMPRVRFGKVHSYNNYFSASGNDYCIAAGCGSQIRIENNYYENVKDPWRYYNTVTPYGLIKASGNTFVNTTGTHSGGSDSIFTVPYTYTLDSASTAKTRVTSSSSGAGTH